MENLRNKKREIEKEKESLRREYGVVSSTHTVRGHISLSVFLSSFSLSLSLSHLLTLSLSLSLSLSGVKADELEKLQTEMKSLQNRLQYSAEDVKLCDSKLKQGEVDMENLEKELNMVKPLFQKLQAQKSAKESTVQVTEKELFKIEDKMYASFCKKVGMPNIREYQSSKLAKSEALIKKKRELYEHKTKLESALEYENSRDLGIWLYFSIYLCILNLLLLFLSVCLSVCLSLFLSFSLDGPLNKAKEKVETVKAKLQKFEKNLSKTLKEAGALSLYIYIHIYISFYHTYTLTHIHNSLSLSLFQVLLKHLLN